MAENLSCSFASFSDHKCDISPRYPGIKEYFPVTSCTKDGRSHLRQVKVSQTTVSTEKDLILARVGLFADDGATRTICPRHRADRSIDLFSTYSSLRIWLAVNASRSDLRSTC